ncbi:MAG: helix-turn-helix domain-containing protein [Halieaceae bacterium]|uniref:helix-turn-helix domain-containing protein n=1 Tax=Haliea alexandrii TaxID=2448162 RepID=UPI000F0B3A70|nr:helix-turn-helix domain-containing protein [Haliea alexandrii]MCR9185414.1 helix-turn-helix domain-containing protein [Halieaceae bacterium]
MATAMTCRQRNTKSGASRGNQLSTVPGAYQTVIQALPILYVLAAGQGIFLAFTLITTRNGNTRANRYLAAYMLVFVCALVDYALDTAGLTRDYIWLRTLLWPKEFLYGVLIYLYCREMTQPGLPQSLSLRIALWGPPFLHCCAAWPLLWLRPELQYAILTSEGGLPDFYTLWQLLLGDIELFVTIAHLSLLLLLSIRLLINHRRHVLESCSNTEKVSLDWLRNILLGTLVVYLVWLMEEFFTSSLVLRHENLDVALGLSMVCLIYALGWLGIRQPRVFIQPIPMVIDATNTPPIVASNPPAGATESGKYARSALSEELAEALIEEAQLAMVNKSLYLSPTLSLAELADNLSVSTNYLSQAINQKLGQNFFDFVNAYRIEHTLTRLKNSNDSVLSIAMDAGFNSKSAFYAAFRKHKGLTPGAYRNRQPT